MGRILGIDHGNRRIGLALSDPLQIISKPYSTITFLSMRDVILKLKKIIKEEDIEKIVLGLPKGMRGQNTSQTKIVREFAVLLREETELHVEFEDERLSSISAQKALIYQGVKTGRNKGRIDETAAAIILQQYLDTQRR